MQSEVKTFVYLGPSLSLIRAMEFLPFATYRPPARQGDILSDIVNFKPQRILLIDGEFRGNLSVWHKEIVYGLQYPNLEGIYGASSMGALRAAELCHLGMIGCGEIFRWYRDGVTEDDAEVAVLYSERETDGIRGYTVRTIPLVDIRAGVRHYVREFPGQPITESAEKFLEVARAIHYTERTWNACEKLWDNAHGVSFPHIPQKELDAVELLRTFADLKSEGTQRPTPENLSIFFHALYERDRRILIKGTEIAQQHLDSHVMLHNPEFERICWDSSNQELALLLCNFLQVQVTMPEIERENVRFLHRSGVNTEPEFHQLLKDNGWNKHEYDRLIIENARIRKLQHSYAVSRSYRRNTAATLDYLRTHQAFDYWALQAIELEKRILKSGVDDWMGIDLDTPVLTKLAQHFEKEGLEFKSSPEEYLLETGFSNMTELGVALTRTAAGKEQDNG